MYIDIIHEITWTAPLELIQMVANHVVQKAHMLFDLACLNQSSYATKL